MRTSLWAPPAEDLGSKGEGRLQNLFTKEIEDYRASALAESFRQTDADYFPARAALNCDRISSVFLTAIPTESNTCLDIVWRAGFANHFGLPFHAFSRHEGQQLRGVKKDGANSVCDKYGNAFVLAAVKGCAGQIKRHDGIAWLLMDMFNQAGYNCQHEANFIFRDCVPAPVYEEWQQKSHSRAGNYITPDIHMATADGAPPILIDVKAVYGGARYGQNRGVSCGAVASRQARAKKEYVNRARVLDSKHNHTPGEEVGPVQTRLEEYGDIKIPVAGMFNEISRDFHDLIAFTAQDIAKKRFEATTLPVESHAELIGPIVWHLKQSHCWHAPVPYWYGL